MPEPRKNEKREDFVNRCIPVVMKDGSAKDNKQAVAMCNSIYENKDSKERIKETQAIPLDNKDMSSECKSKEKKRIYLATTVPDRVMEELPDGRVISGEILSKKSLEDISEMINNNHVAGGRFGDFRTISLFHNRILEKNPELEEAGYMSNASVDELPFSKGDFGVAVDVEVNEMFNPPENYPDYTPEKIKYKLDKKAIGLSLEYGSLPNEEEIVEKDGELFRFIKTITDHRGAGFARVNLIGNPTAVSVKELNDKIKKNKQGDVKMEDIETKFKEMSEALKQISASDDKIKSMLDRFDKMDDKLKEMSENKDDDATVTKIKEAVQGILDNKEIDQPSLNVGTEVDTKIKEIGKCIENKDWKSYNLIVEDKIKENNDMIIKKFKNEGFNFENEATLKVKCVGRNMIVVPTSKTKEVLDMKPTKTKDVIDTTSMEQTDYYQTNAFFADRYVSKITETFLKDDTLLRALNKINFAGGNDKYQWKNWIDFIDASSSSLAVDPDNTSAATNKSDFIKLETPIKEYRDAVEVTDFVEYHSRPVMGSLLDVEATRAAERVTQSMAADIFKEVADGDGLQFLGLEAVADSTGNATLYGKTRTTANRLKRTTLTDTYVSTSESISVTVVRDGYEKVLAAGSIFSDIAIVMNPVQYTRLRNTEDGGIRYAALTMAPNPEFGFKRNVMPHLDAVPIVLDYNCQNDAFYVVDMSEEKGFNLVVSKPLGIRGLAKVGLSEKSYVNFYGCTVYKAPRNIFFT
jgi:uncharacterized protein YdcH (DUF465 family)